MRNIKKALAATAFAGGLALAAAAPALAATGSGSEDSGNSNCDWHFATYTHASDLWLTQCNFPEKFRIGVYCVYPFSRHDWVQGPFKFGNGSDASNDSVAVCNTYGAGNPVDVDLVYYINGAYHTQRVYTG